MRRSRRTCRPTCAPWGPLGLLLAIALATLQANAAVPAPLQTFVQSWCADCHNADSNKGGFSFDGLAFGGEDPAAHARWVRAFDRVNAGEMPPKGKAQPEATAKSAFLAALGKDLTTQHNATKGTVLRRLNRAEYENTLRDLLGMRVEVRDLLPADSLSHGFDNVGEALSMSDVQLARYMEAAEFALDTALTQVTRPVPTKVVHDYKASAARGSHWPIRDEDGAVVFFNNGIEPDTSLKSFRAAVEGNYRFRITGYAHQSKDAITFAVHSGPNGKIPTELLGYYELAPGAARSVTIQTWLRAGETIKISPLLKLDLLKFKESGGKAKYPGPGLAIRGVEVEGPLYEQWPPRAVTLLFGDLAKTAKEAPLTPPSTDKKKKAPPVDAPRPLIEVSSANPDADAARLLRQFASAAFRRPLDDARVAPYLALFQAETKRGATFSHAMRTAAVAILCAPDFLYLREPAGPLDDYALASRLSYFLWRTMPDDELLRLAAAGKLREPATLRAQTSRLLAHANASRFYADFTDAWLNLREIDFTSPDRKLYPEFDGQLQDAMLAESRAFFRELIVTNLSPTNIVASDFAMLNRRLAEHYNIPGVTGLDIRKVPLPPDSKRGGVMTQAAVLKVSANGSNTSPVVRGVWVLERILGQPPQPPPPGVPGLEPDVRGATTLREQLDKHRQLASCNSCHRAIDPPGFALESYDVIGGWREVFRVYRKRKGKIVLNSGPPVDASGETTDGGKFANFADFQKLLLTRPERITHTIAEKLLTFSSGRELGFSDREEVNRIVSQLKTGGMRDLVELVVASPIFQTK